MEVGDGGVVVMDVCGRHLLAMMRLNGERKRSVD